MNGNKETVEVEIALRNAMSAGLKQIVKELDAQNKKIMEVAGIGSKGFKDLADDIGKGTKQTKQSTASFDLIGSALKSLTTGALAPVGIVAGVAAAGVAVAGSIKHFAAANQSFANMAINANLTTRQFSMYTQALRRGGFSDEDAYATITEAGKVMENIGVYGKTSPEYKQLVDADVPQDVLNDVLKFTQGKR